MNGRSRYGEDEDDLGTERSAPATPAIGLTRRRIAMLVAGLFALWLIGVFARQVGEATAASDQADQLRARNAAAQTEVESLRRELALIKQPAFVAEMARGYSLGGPGEIPFVVDPKAPAPGPDAPGSQGIKPDEQSTPASPLEMWLRTLFGGFGAP